MNFNIVLSDLPSNLRAKQVKSLRLAGGLSLKQAYALSQFVGGMKSVVLASGMTKKVAADLCSSLIDSGLDARMEVSDVSVPMVLHPELRSRHRWSLGVLKKLAF